MHEACCWAHSFTQQLCSVPCCTSCTLHYHVVFEKAASFITCEIVSAASAPSFIPDPVIDHLQREVTTAVMT
jgi:hypothetical protein